MTTDESPTENKGQPGFVPAALSGLCPRCGAKTLFDGGAQLADECAACGLDFLKLERGGRFVGVVTMLLAVVLIMAALGMDEWLRPPLWASLLFWGPVTVGSVIGALRLYKAMWVYRGYEERQP
ncbi:MAG: hypothetical protein RLZZ475_2238 [Pseudomonadota bacterium]|jgi:uncharacterized protein (DUF983 family)